MAKRIHLYFHFTGLLRALLKIQSFYFPPSLVSSNGRHLAEFLVVPLILIFLSPAVFPQNNDPSGQILEKVSANYKSFNSFSASFSYEIENKSAGIHEKDNGKVFMMGNKYVIELSGQKIINDGTDLFVYIKSQKEMNISKYEKDDDEITPSNLFTFYNKNFKYIFVEELKEHGSITEIIELTPKDHKRNIFKIRLFIDKKKKLINSAQLFDRNGSIYNYTLTDFSLNPPELNDAFFSFDKSKYPGVHIEDLR
ncbi:MAG: hypothetical protein A3G23_05295 [Bacteroidetes bacterium RIFCSPLOWO2_12_FULL_37_12]|nr:MAG: hypothetical protein A3G23_05295 [Bacteroidetes bacterium RIFCSPLOWO2_12_FULL_37_12]